MLLILEDISYLTVPRDLADREIESPSADIQDSLAYLCECTVMRSCRRDAGDCVCNKRAPIAVGAACLHVQRDTLRMHGAFTFNGRIAM